MVTGRGRGRALAFSVSRTMEEAGMSGLRIVIDTVSDAREVKSKRGSSMVRDVVAYMVHGGGLSRFEFADWDGEAELAPGAVCEVAATSFEQQGGRLQIAYGKFAVEPCLPGDPLAEWATDRLDELKRVFAGAGGPVGTAPPAADAGRAGLKVAAGNDKS